MLKQSYKLFKIAANDNKKPVIKNFLFAIILEIVSVSLLYYLNATYGRLYQAIQSYETMIIWQSITEFTGLAMVLVVVNGYMGYYIDKLAFEIRTGLTISTLKNTKGAGLPNIEQRIQEDLKRFGESACDFWFAVFKSMMYLPVFLGVVISLTEWYVGVAVMSAVVIGTIVTKIVADRIVKEQAIQENNEAEFRKDLSFSKFHHIKVRFYRINRLFKYLSFTQAGISQVFVLLPFVLMMPLYISKAITMGAFFQSVSALGKIIDSLSILIDSRKTILEIQTCLVRLEFLTKE